MTRSLQLGPSVRFGPYQVNLGSGDLRKLGYRVRLQPKSFMVLRALLQRPGELVTREELKSQLWPADTFVEFESSLNVAVRRLRQALCDEAQNPVYIETEPRHGYRFVGAVEAPEHPEAVVPIAGPAVPSWSDGHGPIPGPFVPGHVPGSGTIVLPPLTSRRWSWASWKAAVPAFVLLVALAAGILWRNHNLVRRPAASPTPSIAVLPFVDASPEKNQQYFSEGLAEELLNEPAKKRKDEPHV